MTTIIRIEDRATGDITYRIDDGSPQLLGEAYDTREAAEMALRQRESRTECVYCGREHDGDDSAPVPRTDDDTAWARLAADHADDCEWITTRAHRL